MADVYLESVLTDPKLGTVVKLYSGFRSLKHLDDPEHKVLDSLLRAVLMGGQEGVLAWICDNM